jgi:hypothetical protein
MQPPATVTCWWLMCPADDIPDQTPSTQTERGIKREEGPSRRSVGPESEVRGGPEAVDDTLDEGDGPSGPDGAQPRRQGS